MSSVISKAKSMFSGRETIGLTGVFEKKIVTIDIDIVKVFNSNYDVEITSHPVEKNIKNADAGCIVDHVIPKPPAIDIEANLS